MKWEQIARIDAEPSYLARICWPYDKYPELPQLTAGAEIVLLDADGPGVVTNIHSSKMGFLDDILFTSGAREEDAYSRVTIEITYDGHAQPDIAMPLCAFLGDPDGNCDYYSTRFLSKVRDSHNFRMPMPFGKHIRIAIQNPTDTNLIGYTDLQWKRLTALPPDVGYLWVDYTSGRMRIPEERRVLNDIGGRGAVRAHWFALGCEHPLAHDGEYVCEGNQEFYIDGEERPSLEYLGTEDLYGHSWGLSRTGGDIDAAIIKMAHPSAERTEIAMLRCRAEDSVGFQKSLKLVLDYRDEYFAGQSTNPLHRKGVFAGRERVSFDMEYQSCIYFYR